MNTKALPFPLLDVAHHINLALLPRNHTYQTALIPMKGFIVAVLRHATDEGITAVAVCGSIRLEATRWSWSVYRENDLIADNPAPIPILQAYWAQIGTMALALEKTA